LFAVQADLKSFRLLLSFDFQLFSAPKSKEVIIHIQQKKSSVRKYSNLEICHQHMLLIIKYLQFYLKREVVSIFTFIEVYDLSKPPPKDEWWRLILYCIPTKSAL